MIRRYQRWMRMVVCSKIRRFSRSVRFGDSKIDLRFCMPRRRGGILLRRPLAPGASSVAIVPRKTGKSPLSSLCWETIDEDFLPRFDDDFFDDGLVGRCLAAGAMGEGDIDEEDTRDAVAVGLRDGQVPVDASCLGSGAPSSAVGKG